MIDKSIVTSIPKRKKIQKKKRIKKKKQRKPKKIWLESEDFQLLQLIKKYGPSKWSVIASFMNGR